MSDKAVNQEHTHWDIDISGDSSHAPVNLKELWRYRDLLALFVKRDIITVYKQTILGPIWFVIQPIFTTLTYVVVFGNFARIGTDGVPNILFYLGSVTIWNYFSETLNITSKTFTENASIFGKVYFPRLILPLSKVLSGVIKFLIQFALFVIAWVYYLLVKRVLSPNAYMLLLPVLLLIMAAMSLGFGLLITSLTTKYRDLTFLISFGVQLLMYATPVIYPISHLSKKYQRILWFNPLTSIFETFKYAFFGKGGILSHFWLAYSVVFTLVLLVLGIVVFNKVERRFIDTV